MKQSWQEFPVSGALKPKLAERLQREERIIPFDRDPLLASLICCLGLQSEIGVAGLDRMSICLGVDLSATSTNPWKSEIISLDGCIGIRMWVPGLEELSPKHPDFMDILHPLSLDERGRLSRLVIFPQQVAQRYKNRGLELVIVRDWALSSFLASERENSVNYLVTNRWEIEINSAEIQSELMYLAQVAFFGTHDLADHLLGGDGKVFAEKKEFFGSVRNLYREVFAARVVKKSTLLVSYLIGVLLDDLAQPSWYRSTAHHALVERSLHLLKQTAGWPSDIDDLEPPQSFHRLVEDLRLGMHGKANEAFQDFAAYISKRATAGPTLRVIDQERAQIQKLYSSR